MRAGLERSHKNDLRTGASLLWRQTEKVGVLQSGKEKGAYKKEEERLFTRICSDRTRGF